MSQSKCGLDSSVDILHYGQSGASVEHSRRCWRAELEKHIKSLLSSSIFQRPGGKKMYLVKTSTCCWAQRAKERGQLQDLCGMSLCRERPWTLVSSSWKQPARIALFFSSCLCSCSLAGKRGRRMSLNPERKERKPTKPSEFLRKAAYLLDPCIKAVALFLDSGSDISLAFPAHSFLILSMCHSQVEGFLIINWGKFDSTTQKYNSHTAATTAHLSWAEGMSCEVNKAHFL